jgi:hypothetical protein
MIEQTWIVQDLPEERKLQDARSALTKCLQAAGVKVGDGATSEELAGLVGEEAFWPCAREVEREFQLPGFAG